MESERHRPRIDLSYGMVEEREAAEWVKFMVERDRLKEASTTPMLPKIIAAGHGLAIHRIDRMINGVTPETEEYGEAVNARLMILNDEERQLASDMADEWLNENFDPKHWRSDLHSQP